MPTKDWYGEIHERLLADDPTAPAELAQLVLELLTKKLSMRHPELRGSELLLDAVTDALISYIKRPDQFNPAKRGLLGFLTMAAEGDLLNALAKLERRREKEVILEDVELLAASGKKEVEDKDPVAELEAQRVRKEVKGLFNDPKDRQMAELILEGERSTEAFAEILGLESVPIDDRRREVKRHKDRIKKRIERYGKRIRERQN